MSTNQSTEIALVTGASRGIGRAIATRLAADGAHVIVHYNRSLKEAEALVQEIVAAGGRAVASTHSVSSEEGAQAIVQTAIDAFGAVDILINNAAISVASPIYEMSPHHVRQHIDVNLMGQIWMVRAVWSHMQAARYGRIVNIGSVVGTTGNPGQGNYAAAKAGLVGLTKALAAEVASRNVTVNCVSPGFIASPMTDVLNEKQREGILGRVPAGRLGEGAEVAAAVVYLASAEAAYVTGQTLHVNGGMAMV